VNEPKLDWVDDGRHAFIEYPVKPGQVFRSLVRPTDEQKIREMVQRTIKRSHEPVIGQDL
jgi:hypothetical protein